MIFTCTCKHEGQDKLHGSNKRVFNKCVTNGPQKKYRCTVCKKEKQI